MLKQVPFARSFRLDDNDNIVDSNNNATNPISATNNFSFNVNVLIVI